MYKKDYERYLSYIEHKNKLQPEYAETPSTFKEWKKVAKYNMKQYRKYKKSKWKKWDNIKRIEYTDKLKCIMFLQEFKAADGEYLKDYCYFKENDIGVSFKEARSNCKEYDCIMVPSIIGTLINKIHYKMAESKANRSIKK